MTNKNKNSLTKKIIAGVLATICLCSSGAVITSVNAADVKTEDNPNNKIMDTKNSTAMDEFINSLKYDENKVLATNGDIIKGSDGEIISRTVTKDSDTNKLYITTKTKKSITNKPMNAFTTLGSINGVAYPGALFLANQALVQGNPTPITDVERSKMKFSITGIGIGGSQSIEATPNSFSDVNEAIATLARRWDGKTTRAQMNISSAIARSESQIEASLGLSASIIDKLNIDFNSISDSKKSTAVMSLSQIYFTINADIKKGAKVFADNASVEDLQFLNGVNSENPPVMVDSVNYGRMVYVTIDSTASSNELSLAVEAAKSGISGKLDTKYKSILDNCTYNIMICGGGTDTAGKLLTVKGYDDFVKAISETSSFSSYAQSVPVSFTTRFIKSGNSATAYVNTDYIETTTKVQDGISVQLNNKDMDGRIDYGKYTITGKRIIDIDNDGKYIYANEDYSRTETDRSSNGGISFTIPSDIDQNTIKITLSYSGTGGSSLNEPNYYLKDAGLGTISGLKLELEGTTKWWGGYRVDGRIHANGTLVHSTNDN